MKTVSRKQPMRTCVACGKSDAKQEFIRLVQNKDGEVSCDTSGRLAGRGAYLCADAACFTAAMKQGRLSKALRCQLSEDDQQRLKVAFGDACRDFA